ncbi:inheritance of peroxisomes protein 1-domain-containing protein, partial [Coniella lustricola]
VPRRHSTVPTSFQPVSPRPSPEPIASGSVETLYSHPSIRIVAFTAGKSALERTKAEADDKPGTLPSSSAFERAIAVGAFQIYRAPGSVAFLRSGSALQPILPKSQAWCLDEQLSKFVLQIRRPNYWRIEVPVGNDEEMKRAHMLRDVLGQILQFEKTPCPFERSFIVELPEPPQTPIKKRTWTPPARTVSMNWPPGQPITPPPEFHSHGTKASLEGSGQLRVRRTRVAAFASRRAAAAPLLRLHTSSSLSGLNSVQERTATAETDDLVEPGSPAESMDSFHSVQSWHSALSPPALSPVFPPTNTFPYPHDNIPLSQAKGRDLSGLLSTPTTSKWDRTSTGTTAGTAVPSPNTPWSEVQDEPAAPPDALKEADTSTSSPLPVTTNIVSEQNTTIAEEADSLSASWSSAASHTSYDSNNSSPMRHRTATTTSVAISHRSPRALSPLPPAANLLTTDISSRTISAARAIRRIPSSIFNKTCEILISPPAHLISLMLKVAARISAGEWQGFVFGMDESGEVVDVRWDYGDALDD